jgi:putative Holliday junction resolvase
MGIDPGTRRIGVAVSDELGMLARAVATVAVAGDGTEVGELAKLARELEVERIVVGLPRHMNGSEGESAQAARLLAENLSSRTGLPVILWDERLTTKGAERILIAADLPRSRRRRIIDQQAAQWILQSYLDQWRGPAS